MWSLVIAFLMNSTPPEFKFTNLAEVKTYKECKDLNKLKKIQFYCEVFQHSINTQHYYHISHKGYKFKTLLWFTLT